MVQFSLHVAEKKKTPPSRREIVPNDDAAPHGRTPSDSRRGRRWRCRRCSRSGHVCAGVAPANFAAFEASSSKAGLMSFFVKAAIDALKQFPQLNAEIRGDEHCLLHIISTSAWPLPPSAASWCRCYATRSVWALQYLEKADRHFAGAALKGGPAQARRTGRGRNVDHHRRGVFGSSFPRPSSTRRNGNFWECTAPSRNVRRRGRQVGRSVRMMYLALLMTATWWTVAGRCCFCAASGNH